MWVTMMARQEEKSLEDKKIRTPPAAESVPE
jgi:hypothetical protein